MPKLPDATALGERPIARSTVGYRAPADVTAVGTAVAGLGKTIQKIDEQMDEFDKLRAEDAYNQLLEKKIDLTKGEKGFLNRRGADAANNPLLKEYGGELEKYTGELAKGLSNDRQRQYFQKRANIPRLQMRQDILGHTLKERDVYAKQNYESTKNIETTNAIDQYKDPLAIAGSKKRIENAINTEARRQGWSTEFKKAEKAAVMSNLHGGIIDRMLANDEDIAAEDYYKKYKKEFIDKAKVEKLLEISSTRNQAMRLADKIVAQTKGDLRLALDKARNIKREKKRTADRKSTRLNSSHTDISRMPSSA